VSRTGLARNRARKLLDELGINSPPVKLAPIVKHLNIKAFEQDFKEGLSGISLTDEEGKSFIGYRKLDHDHRKRFSVAHEIGHIMLGHTHPKTYGEIEKADSCAEANEFASELLMPLRFLKLDIASGITNPKKLIERYWVSEQAFWVKIRNSGLLSKLI